jgi:GAF domain-containing protein
MNSSITESRWLIIHDLSKLVECSMVSSVLELVVSISDSDAAHLYWMDPAAYELRLVGASSTPEDGRIPRVSLEFSPAAKLWLEGLRKPGALSSGDAHLSSFPETVASEVASLMAFPLRWEGKLAGILTLSRRDSRSYGSSEIEPIGKLADALIAAAREMDHRREVESLREKLRLARRENTLLERRLAERKLVERAKGLLQAHFDWTEEEAYYHLRRTSRQQRTPMAVIAQRIIDNQPVATPVSDRRRAVA